MSKYFDMRAVLQDGVKAVKPSIMGIADGNALFYSGKVNSIFGDPESGKTWVALAAVADELSKGHRAAYIDIDHNGAEAIGVNLMKLGVDFDVLCDQNAFRLSTPNDEIEFDALVADLVAWEPDLVVLDSMGELLPIFGASSNDSDDFTVVNRRVFTPLIVCGAGVVCVDHLAKGDSRSFGPTGTMAKRRIIGGLMLRITVSEPFAPGRGGKAHLNVFKDRHGGVRSQVAHDKTKEPLIGEFVLSEDDEGVMSWAVEPRQGTLTPKVQKPDMHAERVEKLLNAGRMPASIQEAKSFLKCSQDNAKRALEEAREKVSTQNPSAA